MRLKTNVEGGVILLFNVVIFGYSKLALAAMIEKIWLNHRWAGRFYFSINERCYKHVINVTTLNRKEILSKEDFVRLVKGAVPKGKKYTID
jgi:hypothetical protein